VVDSSFLGNFLEETPELSTAGRFRGSLHPLLIVMLSCRYSRKYGEQHEKLAEISLGEVCKITRCRSRTISTMHLPVMFFLKESVSRFYLTSTLSNCNVRLFQVLPLSLASTFVSAFLRRLQCVQ
jgi:hypothetical protein